MPARVETGTGSPPARRDLEVRMVAEGLTPRSWANGPGYHYDWHRHGYHKVLYCVSGSIVFHTRDDGDLALGAGDRLDIDPGTDHAATVGAQGVECIEAAAESSV